jgi:NADPH:quinone reductase-like Zn-dependent oxidoreductase
MCANHRKQFGGLDVLEIREMPEPEPKACHAVIEIMAFGLNHAKLHMPMAFPVSPVARWLTGASLRMDGGEVKSI